ncbi:ABC transporter ATP-binding protein [Streptosporangium pseudovulgare]|uniref:ABC transporter ATP-binding protein n=1 Tax=Streptosporangium pseudovulgare TaxID=35765 RepID=A0ABQ2R9W8_9ACTN|nr:ABC transporter ATP-binding protein [Streptosporangium pseudovulgare]GGQ17485.1 ABC transporter ATP-binding protein [Streptosporangium pseudovulgare]
MTDVIDPARQGSPVIDVVDLRAEPILHGVSFQVPAGQVLAIVGASGSGKTTTALALLGEHPPGVAVTGAVTVAGQRITAARPPTPGTVGFIPQHPSSVLNPVRRIGAVLREIATRHGTSVEAALRRASLPSDRAFLRRYPHQLSGGQQQRLAVAQALLGDPAVIVADEPTTGQDTATRDEVVRELSELARQGITIVLLSHDLDIVRTLAGQVVVLRDGQVVEAGPTDSVLADPREKYTRELVAAQPGVDDVTTRTVEAGPRLETTGLTARHGRATVLREVSVRAAAGECLAVVGRSGSGKTTLARCIAGLHRPQSGSVRLDGRELTRRTRKDLAAVQYVFQDARASFDPHRTVLDQVARTAVRLRDMSTEQARTAALEILAEVGLPADAMRRRPGGLSGGELQRCALARALLAEPSVLICDEITSGLDTLTRATVLDHLQRLTRRRHLTLIMISHDLGVVARIADHVVVIHDGQVTGHGPAAVVLSPFAAGKRENAL